jgi:O-antigen/teichoic acid export membrane protein
MVAGFGGIGGATLAAAFIGSNYVRLAQTWQVLIKVETLLAVTGLVFCLFNAQNIALALYGPKYAPMGSLFAIFLFFNILTRIVGSTIHQLTLYVTGKAPWVALSQWVGIGIALVGGILLIPSTGAAGALIADGIAKTLTGALMLLVVLREFPHRYPLELLNFTVRFLLALVLAALPGLIWHPTDRLLLALSGLIFVLLSLALLTLIKPLSGNDLQLLKNINPRFSTALRWFARPD